MCAGASPQLSNHLYFQIYKAEELETADQAKVAHADQAKVFPADQGKMVLV